MQGGAVPGGAVPSLAQLQQSVGAGLAPPGMPAAPLSLGQPLGGPERAPSLLREAGALSLALPDARPLAHAVALGGRWPARKLGPELEEREPRRCTCHGCSSVLLRHLAEVTEPGECTCRCM